MKKGMLFIVNIVITKRHKSKNRTIGFKLYMKIPITTRNNTESNLKFFKKKHHIHLKLGMVIHITIR